jgi:hypothetical protein
MGQQGWVVHELQPGLEVRELEHPLDALGSAYQYEAAAGRVGPDGGTQDQAQTARVQERHLAQIDQDDRGLFGLGTTDTSLDLIGRRDVYVTLEGNLHQVRAGRVVRPSAAQPPSRPGDQAFRSPSRGRHGASLARSRTPQDSP